jgi:hypothetical protein
MIRLFARHTGRRVRGAPLPWICEDCDQGNHARRGDHGISPVCQCACARPLAIEAPRDDYDEDYSDSCGTCGAGPGIRHRNGCTEDPDAMCLCHLGMDGQAVTPEMECPYHGGERERPSWRDRLAGAAAALIDATARGMAWLADHVVLEEMRAAGLRRLCDWGDCDEPATGERWDGELGWLPVCDYHAEPDDEDDDDPAAQVTCPHCGHPGFDGGVCGRCGWGYGYQHAHEAAVAAVYAPGQLPVTPRDDDATDIFSQPRITARREARRTIWQPPRAESHWDRYTRAFGVPETLAYVAEILAAPLPQVKALTA